MAKKSNTDSNTATKDKPAAPTAKASGPVPNYKQRKIHTPNGVALTAPRGAKVRDFTGKVVGRETPANLGGIYTKAIAAHPFEHIKAIHKAVDDENAASKQSVQATIDAFKATIEENNKRAQNKQGKPETKGQPRDKVTASKNPNTTKKA